MAVRKPVIYRDCYLGFLTEGLADRLLEIRGLKKVEAVKHMLFNFSKELIDRSISENRSIREIIKEENIDWTQYQGELRDYQTTAVAFMYFNPRMILGDDAGTGKTAVSSGLINYLKAKKQLSRFIFVCEPQAVPQVKRELIKFTGLHIIAIDGQANKMRKQLGNVDWAKLDGIVAPHSVLKSDTFNLFLADNINENGKSRIANVFILDESSIIKNDKTKTFEYTKNIADIIPRFYMLNATAFENYLIDIVNQIEILSGNILPSRYAIQKNYCEMEATPFYRKSANGGAAQRCMSYDIVGYKNQQRLKELCRLYYYGRTRKEMGMKDNSKYKVVPAEVSKQQAELLSRPYLSGRYNAILNCPTLLQEWKYEFNTETVPKLGKLIEEITGEFNDKKIMVYAFNIDSHLNIQRALTEVGKSSVILNGTVKTADRGELQNAYNDGKYDVIITNFKKSLNLDTADVCILYDIEPNPARTTQITQRINRGTGEKQKTYVMLYYKDSPEEQYFVNVVAQRSSDSKAFTKNEQYAVDEFMKIWIEENEKEGVEQ